MNIKKILSVALFFIVLNGFGQSQFSSFQVEYNYDSLLHIKKSINDRQGNVYLIGDMDNSGTPNVVIIKTNSLGRIEWQNIYPSSDSMLVYSAALTQRGGLIVGGTKDPRNNLADKRGFLLNIAANGNVLWSREIGSFLGDEIEIFGVFSSRRNGFFVTGYVDLDSLDKNILLAKYDTSGSLLWSNTYGDLSNDIGYRIIEENNGNIVVAGTTDYDSVTQGSAINTDIVLLRTNSTGNNILQFEAMGTPYDETVADLALGSDGRYTVIANGVDSNSMNNMIYAVRFNTNGTTNFCKSYSSNANSIIANDLDLSVSGQLLINGIEDYSFNFSPFSIFTDSDGDLIDSKTDLIFNSDANFTNSNTRGADNGIASIFATGTSMNFPPLISWRMVKGDNEFNSDCGFQNANYSSNTCTLSLNTMGGRIGSMSSSSFNLSARNTGISDSVTCCRISAPVAGDTIRMCEGSQVNLGRLAISGYNYSWSGVGNNFTSTSANPSVSPTETTTYKLVVTANGCDGDSALVTVVVAAPRTDLVFRDSFYCEGDSIIYSFSPNIANFSWTFGNNVFLTNPAIFKESATVIFAAQDINNCQYRDTFEVEEKPLPVINLIADTLICDNVEIDLIGPAGMAQYIWNGTSTSNQIFTTGVEQRHTLAVVDSFGCEASASTRILHQPSSQFSLGPDTTICEGTTYVLQGPLALFDLRWNDVPSTSPFFEVTQAGTYTLQASNSFGCISYDTVVITESPAPTFSLGGDTSYCEGSNLLLSGPTATEYEWSMGDNTQSVVVSSEDTVWLNITNDLGCSFADTIFVEELPAPEFSLGADTVICQNQTLTIGVDDDFVGYSWNTGATTPTITVTATGVYELTVTGQNGCSSTDQIRVDTCTSSVPRLEQKFNVEVYPNPVNTELNIVLNAQNYTYELLDISAKSIISDIGRGNHSVIQTSNLTAGMYLLRISKDGYISYYKILVSR
jgi:hypothetical protein